MLARREYHPPERDHAFLLDRLAYYNVSLSAHLSIRGDVVGIVQIEIVDLFSRHELIDVDRMCAFGRGCLELILGYLDVVSFADLVTHDDVLVIDLFTGHRVDLAVFDPISGLAC